MMDNNSQTITTFNPLLIALHWIMLLVIVSAYLTMLFSDSFPKGSAEQLLIKARHFSLGFTVLLLVIIRIILRVSTKVPPIVPPPDIKQLLLAKIMHGALYAFMIIMPLLGWLTLSAHGESLPFWGLKIPPLMGVSNEFGHWCHELHELGATVGYFLIGLHAAAGLYHHYKLRDNTLLRMSFLKK